MSLQWEKIMWTEEVLNWIPTKSVPEWLNELTGTHSFIGHLEILQGASQEGKETLICAFLLPGLFHFLIHIFSSKNSEKSSELSFCVNMC